MTTKHEWEREFEQGVDAIAECDFEGAQKHLEAARQALDADGRGSSVDAEQVLYQLAEVRRFRNDYTDSKLIFEELLRLQQHLYGDKSHELAPTYQSWADTCVEASDFVEAEQLSWKGIDVFLPYARTALRTYGELLGTLAHAERMQGKAEQAIEHARAAFHIIEIADAQKSLGLLHPLQTYVAALKALGESPSPDSGVPPTPAA